MPYASGEGDKGGKEGQRGAGASVVNPMVRPGLMTRGGVTARIQQISQSTDESECKISWANAKQKQVINTRLQPS